MHPSHTQAMHTVGIQQLYDSDPRPTFIVDCAAEPAAIYHVNLALLALPRLAQSLRFQNALRDWWDPMSSVDSRLQASLRHGRYQWMKFSPCQRWLVVVLVEQPPDIIDACSRPPKSIGTYSSNQPLDRQPDTIFTIKVQSTDLQEHIERLRRVDWTATSLGPIATWSHELNRLMTTLMLETRPTALFLGPDHIIIYNLAYAIISGSRHPGIIGRRIIDAWPELADPVGATIDRSRTTQFIDAPEEEYHFMIERGGLLEESFFMWSLIPLVGSIDGMYSTVTEVTKQRYVRGDACIGYLIAERDRLLERRVGALLRLAQLTSQANNAEAFWAAIRDTIHPYEYDFPTAILYSCLETENSALASSAKPITQKCVLQWTIGYSADHPAIPKTLDLADDNGLAPGIIESAIDDLVTIHHREDNVLPMSIYTEVERRGFGDPCRAMLIIPIRTSKKSISGHIVLGVNTRRPYDTEYKDWIEVLATLLSTSAASVALHEEDSRRQKQKQDKATEDREALTAEVAVLVQEANEKTRQLQNLHNVTNAVGVGYFEFDISGQLMHANDAFLLQTGHPRDLVNAPPFAFLDRVYEPDLALAMNRWHILASGEATTYEMRWRKEPNQDHGSEDDTRNYLWTLTACIPMQAEDGSVTGIFGCNTDISGQKEATRIALLRAEAERRLANFTESAPVGVYQCDSELNIEYCNDQWFRVLGHPKVPLHDIDWQSVVFEEDLESVNNDITITRTGGRPHTFSFRARKKWTGPDHVSTQTWILAMATAHHDSTGKVISFMGTLTDVSQLKWAEAIQRSRVEEALESKRQQENFIDMTSHEVRIVTLSNPLSAMVQCADSISLSLGEMKDLTDEETLDRHPIFRTKLKDTIRNSVEAIETIQACATHQKRIVDDVLTLSKLDSKLLFISPITVQPAALLQDVYKMFKEQAGKASVNLVVQCDASFTELGIHFAILDPSRVLQVLINLITNAIKFTHKELVRRVDVVMSASRHAREYLDIQYVPQKSLREDYLEQPEWGDGETFYLHFTVRDTGCGLTREHKEKLFMRFSQASPRTYVQYGGSGLGLFISRELTEMQGGRIGVQSTHGNGSKFSFYIKSRRANKPPQPDPGAAPMPTRNKAHVIQDTRAGTPKNGQLQSMHAEYHILIVEDNLINQRVLCNQLKKIGCTIQVANHGREALDELRKTTYSRSPTRTPPYKLSVVLMDVEMPVMDGKECAKAIRALQKTGEIVGHVPIIAVSANARREQIEQAKGAGMDDAISKPFRIPELMASIDNLLGKNLTTARTV
ncbi:hypothetical protein DE146DRAFT_697545 [Phaeosphaeria sp. MPI-PUGE-AT-0046c]|nr:hypothetical protein DE146DRAFT_697545 [Phaeosphaeria sp. MPI-PUGE-AT-0046c]